MMKHYFLLDQNMIETKRKCVIVAHRGASNIAPENTMKAFRKAIELNADYIELDVRESKDGYLVISHEGDIFKTTGQHGLIKDMTLDELRKLDFGEGEQIPLLEEVVKLSKGIINLNCEIKVENVGKKALKLLRDADMLGSTIISSFKHDELLKIQKLSSDIKLASLVEIEPGFIISWSDKKSMIEFAARNKFYSINPFYSMVDKDFIEYCRKFKLKIFPWTVNSKIAIKRLIKLGIDGIITNQVQDVKEILNVI
jgi:glycerophosphoryl diester phosphodiesterase